MKRLARLLALVVVATGMGWVGVVQAAQGRLAEIQQQEQRLLVMRSNLLASLRNPDILIIYGGESGPPYLLLTREQVVERLIGSGFVQPRGDAVPAGLGGLLFDVAETMSALSAHSDYLKNAARTRILPEIDARLAELRRAAPEAAAPARLAPGLSFDRVVHGVALDSKHALGRLIHIEDITADENEGRVHVRIALPGTLGRRCEETYQLRWSIAPDVGYLPRNVDLRVDLEAQRTGGTCNYGLYTVELSARGSGGAQVPAWLRLDKPRVDLVTTLRGGSAVTGGNGAKWSRPGQGTATIRIKSEGIKAGPQFRSLYFWIDLMARTGLEEATVHYRFAYVLRPE